MYITTDRFTKEKEIVSTRVRVEGRLITLGLFADRYITFSPDRYEIRKKATDEELRGVKLRAGGTVLRWETLDENLTVEGIVASRFQI